jgi:recombinational DNA repair ATPase RecF
MTVTNPFEDAARFGTQMMQSWEKAMDAWWSQSLARPEFMDQLTQAMQGHGDLREQYDKAMEQTLQHLHLPSREQQQAGREVMEGLTRQIIELAERVEGMRTELEPLHSQLTGIARRLDAIEKGLAAPAKAAPARKTSRAKAKAEKAEA